VTFGVLAPAHSPLSLRALGAGAAGMVWGATDARLRLTDILSKMTGAEHVLLTDSGTSALQIAIRESVRSSASPVVAIPAWACYDVLSAVLGSGTAFKFYDVDPTTLGPSDAALEQLAEGPLSAVVLVHAFGIPVDVPRVRATLPDHVRIIEDAAQAWGAEWEGRPVGRQADNTTYSFGRGKGITGGSGGAVTSRSPFEVVPPPADRGGGDLLRVAVLWSLASPPAYAVPASLPFLKLGSTHFRPPRPYGSASDVAVRIVLSVAARAREAANRRRVRGNEWLAALAGREDITTVRLATEARPSFLRFPVLAADAIQRARYVVSGRALGVAAGYPQPLPALAATLGVAPVERTATPGAEVLARRLFTLPTHDRVSPDVVADTLRRVLV
jgi:perosamine synthetase